MIKKPRRSGAFHRQFHNPPLVPSATDCVGRIFRRRAADGGGCDALLELLIGDKFARKFVDRTEVLIREKLQKCQ